MTTKRDIRELIAEQASSPTERKAVEAVADRVDNALSQEVPYRPEFRAELRRKLMAQARRQAPPSWYRRPAVWGSAAAMAAAVGILAVGLSLWPGAGTQPNVPPAPVTPGKSGDTTPKHVSFPDLPRVPIADEQLLAGHPGPEPLAGLNVESGIAVFKLQGQPSLEQFRKIAAGLKFSSSPETGSDGWTVNQSGRSLRMGKDGRVQFSDNTPPAAGARLVDAAEAGATARQFLLDASLPFTGQPLTMEGNVGGRRLFRFTYTPRVDGRPAINMLTVVTVSDRNAVVEADGYVQFVPEDRGKADAVTPDEARAQAGQRDSGGYVPTGLDLVYARTATASGDWYLQPYWRVFGKNAGGAEIARYLPALKP